MNMIKHLFGAKALREIQRQTVPLRSRPLETLDAPLQTGPCGKRRRMGRGAGGRTEEEERRSCREDPAPGDRRVGEVGAQSPLSAGVGSLATWRCLAGGPEA